MNSLFSLSKSVSDDNVFYIQDIIFGSMGFNALEKSLIDTPIFQSMKRLYQLGCVYLVYPSATHTRFQHSLQVAHLSTCLLEHLNTAQPELHIDSHLIQLVRLAALCHDLGHFPILNHVFDDMCKSGDIKVPNSMKHHEDRSCALLSYLMSSEQLDISLTDVNLICAMIKGEILPKPLPSFWFQIVANHNSGGIDCDRLSYLTLDAKMTGLQYKIDIQRLFQHARIVEDRLVFHEKVATQVFEVFRIRHNMHREVYRHPAVLRIQLMFMDLLILLSQIEQWETYFDNIHTWRLLLTDNVIEHIPYMYFKASSISGLQITTIINMYELYQRIQSRDLYRLLTNEEINEQVLNQIKIQSQQPITLYPVHRIICYKTILSLTGNENSNHPLDLPLCYRVDDKDKVKSKFIINTRESVRISNLLSENTFEYRTIYCTRESSLLLQK